MNAESFVPLQAQPGGGFDFSFFLMMGAIFFIFYMLVIRPQQRQQKEREAHLRTAAGPRGWIGWSMPGRGGSCPMDRRIGRGCHRGGRSR